MPLSVSVTVPILMYILSMLCPDLQSFLCLLVAVSLIPEAYFPTASILHPIITQNTLLKCLPQVFTFSLMIYFYCFLISALFCLLFIYYFPFFLLVFLFPFLLTPLMFSFLIFIFALELLPLLY